MFDGGFTSSERESARELPILSAVRRICGKIGDVAGTIVVGIDGSEHAAAALRWAAEEAALRSAKLEVVHAWSYVPAATPADAGLMPMAWTESVEMLDTARAGAERIAADQVRDVLGEGSGAKVTVVEGGTAEVLRDAAAHADLLVVGNEGRGNLASAVFGSTSAELADTAPCPVVIVRAPTPR
jgi:nucleotide-binding universal stress UspA family protein